jgi:hypothetical protein
MQGSRVLLQKDDIWSCRLQTVSSKLVLLSSANAGFQGSPSKRWYLKLLLSNVGMLRLFSHHRRASLKTYLFLFIMITKIWSGFWEPQKDHGTWQWRIPSFSIRGLSVFRLRCCVVFCCFVLFFVGRSLDPSLVWRCRFSFKKTASAEYMASPQVGRGVSIQVRCKFVLLQCP